MLRRYFLIVVSVALMLGVIIPSNAAGYTVRVMGDAIGPLAINDSGEVRGFSTSRSPRQALLWKDGVLTEQEAFASVAPNSSGQKVDSIETSVGTHHAALLQNNTTTDIGTLGGLNSTGKDINDLGQVVGTSDIADGYYDSMNTWRLYRHVFIWQSGVMADLGILSNHSESFGIAINDSGQVVGNSRPVGIENGRRTCLYLAEWHYDRSGYPWRFL